MEPMSVRIGKVLLEKEIVTRTILEKALTADKNEPKSSQRRLQQILVEDFKIDHHPVYAAISQLYGFKEIDTDEDTVDDAQLNFIQECLNKVPDQLRERMLDKRVLPFRVSDAAPSILSVIAADPLDKEIPLLFRELPYTQVDISYCRMAQIDDLIERVLVFRNEFLQHIEASIQSVEAYDDDQVEVDEAALDAEINRSMLTNLIEGALVEAVRKGASDLHIMPKEGNITEFHLRVDGKLQLWHKLNSVKPESVAAVVKDRSANIDRFNRLIAQDGYIQRKIDNHHIRFRVSVIPIAGTEVQRRFESVVIRVLDDRKVITDFDTLGLQQQAKNDFTAALTSPQGMIILTGPTGSGKSTTLIAALHSILDPSRNVVSVEEPVEYLIRGARQVKIGPQLSFDQALRAVLRHDPDVVMVGEMRDLKSAEIAVSLANTGHITFTTLHTNDAPSAVARLYMLGVEPFLIANAINLIMAQRLIRRLCAECKRPDPNPDIALARFLGFKEEEIEKSTFYQAVGCEKCFEGYHGRLAIMEALLFTPDIRSMILKAADFVDEDQIRQEAIRNGMLTLRASGRERVKAQLTTMDEVASATAE